MTTSTPDTTPALVSLTATETTVGGLRPGTYGYLRTRKGSLFTTDEVLAVHAEALVQRTDDGLGPYCHRIIRHLDGSYAITLVADTSSAPRISADPLTERIARGENLVEIQEVTTVGALTHLSRVFLENARATGYGPALSGYATALLRLAERALGGHR